MHPFSYDPFQQRAIETIDRGTSLFVAAPTGAGKTVIADYVIEQALARYQQVIYTAPVKALSNQKFRDFSARHGDEVGIMTGDVTLNPSAALLIMTTEIYRNTLLEDPARLARCAWVIFDEVHYLDDPERGTVWEEAILFTPSHINLLALSATIPNVDELATWIRQVHEREVAVIVETQRPVPLHTLFQCQNKMLASANALKHEGYRNREEWPRQWSGRNRVRHRRHDRAGQERWTVHPNRLDHLIEHLRATERLPCILFTFGRRRTEELAWEASRLPLIHPEEQAQLRRLFRELCERYQLTRDPTAQALSQLIDRGVAYHHAGMLPTVKEVVERCFVSRLVKFIVTTETFALGINMPARSVVIDTLKKRVEGHVDLIRSRQFLQMAGRAGRRGMDEAGYVYLRIQPTMISYYDVMRVIRGQPELVQSRWNTAYATLLNLYRRHGRGLLSIFPKTFYAFQTSGRRREAGLALMERKLDLLEAVGYLGVEGLTERGEFASWLYGYELLLTELHTQGHLDRLDAPSLAVLLASVVYEPRPGLRMPKSTTIGRRLEHLCEEPMGRIHRLERQFGIRPVSKSPAFQLSPGMEAWFHGAAFVRLNRLCEVDEGEIVRYFRMTVQLLRQLAEAPAAEDALRRKATLAISRINRDVIDAEQQLRLG
ncbi:MAG: DEAD/DEAH box helicase [Candidatus Omnitrophica bacterium]|nr:DEAD/DEAH box helicase [Candidatus Omnitrophota bacterium]